MEPLKVSVLIGPGAHGAQLVDVLTDARWLRQAVYYYPDFVVERGRPPGREIEARVRSYRHAVRLMWAVWRRLPVLGRFDLMRSPHYALFDRLASRYVPGADLLVGWTQVSLRSLSRARELGIVALLEHPMSHIDLWMGLSAEEHAAFGRKGRACNSLFSRAIVDRMRREYEVADAIMVLSTFAAGSFVAAGVAQKKLIQIPLGVDSKLFHPAPPRPQRDGAPFCFLYVGRLELLKGVQYLLRAFAGLRGAHAELWLAGTVFPEMHQVLARYADPRVRVLGQVSPRDLPGLYRQADAFVFPSINDAFGLVVLEAMASGLPVITTDHSVAGDAIEEGRSGHVVPIRSVAALQERMHELLRDPERARHMGMIGRQRAGTAFTWARYDQQIRQAYQQLMRPGKDAPRPFIPSLAAV